MSDRLALVVPRNMGTKALQRLGVALASRADLSPLEQSLYEDFIGAAKDRVVGVQTFLEVRLPEYAKIVPRLAGADIVGRIKTRNTLADKLERTPSEKLPSIHDVAGVRLVAGCSIAEQQSLLHVLKTEFDEHVEVSRPALLINRLEFPMHGYRALHLVVWPGGRPVEIQVRTQLQHAWAQAMEVIGDRWGREARYGLPVVASTERVRDARQKVVDSMKEISALIENYEARAQITALAHLNISEKTLVQGGIKRSLIQQAKKFTEEHERELEEAADNLHTMLRSFSENFASGNSDVHP